MIGDTKLELDVTVREGAPRVDYTLRVDWREIGHPERGTPHLKVRFPLDVSEPQPRYEIPFGSIRRDLFNGEEVPALRWADLSDVDGRGVTLANSSKYGFSVEGHSLNMTLLRASIDPDPLPDLGDHIIEYSLIPHGHGWTVGDCARVGEDANVPLVVASCGFHDGNLPSAKSFVGVEGENVRLAAMKLGQYGKGIVLRLIEVEGRDCQAQVKMASDLLPEGATAVEVDTLERPLASNGARMENGTIVVEVPAYGIATVRIEG
jgi:alpha-mannosidase